MKGQPQRRGMVTALMAAASGLFGLSGKKPVGKNLNPDLSSILPQPRAGRTSSGLPEVRPTKRYRSKEKIAARAIHRRNERANRKRLTAQMARRKAYTMAHHDKLVRKHGAKAVREIERQITAEAITWQEAMAI